jgi:DNA polymerase III gamma/tau subunit
MCHADDPFRCTDCPSCQSFAYNQYGNLEHPDFTEVDAASIPGVAVARSILEMSDQPPKFDKRRVILIDEAHRLSEEAWDVYLRPLEIRHTGAVFIFSTTDPKTIPGTIRSRCTFLEFGLVTRDEVLGLLMATADREKIGYTLDGLRHITDMAHGRPRTALNMLQTVAVTGPVTPENCRLALVASLTDTATKILELLAELAKPDANGDDLMVDILRRSDLAAQVSGPAPLIEALFQVYARAFFENSAIAHALSNFKVVTAVFLKWSRTQQIPIDVIPLLLMELVELLPGKTSVLAQPEQRQTLRRRALQTELIQDNAPTTEGDAFTVDDFTKLLMGANQ